MGNYLGNSGHFSPIDADNMVGAMLGQSMRVAGIDPFGDSIRKTLAPVAPPMSAEQVKADQAKRIASQENQAWLASLTPENRRIYQLMQQY